jgi:hypothetical protein
VLKNHLAFAGNGYLCRRQQACRNFLSSALQQRLNALYVQVKFFSACGLLIAYQSRHLVSILSMTSSTPLDYAWTHAMTIHIAAPPICS